MKFSKLSSYFGSLIKSSLLLGVIASPEVFANAFDPIGGNHLAVWRPSNGTWYVKNRTTGASFATQWGQAGDVPVPGDYDGDGNTDLAVFRPSSGTWYIIRSSDGGSESWNWGVNGDVPLPPSSPHELTVWRPSNGTWYHGFTNGKPTSVRQWGQAGDIPMENYFTLSHNCPPPPAQLCLSLPLLGDTVWRPSNGVWYTATSEGTSQVQWGQNGDKPVPADYVGDGWLAQQAIWRPSTGVWWIRYANGTFSTKQWGQSGDIPITGDYDGDGKADFNVWRPSNGTWYIAGSKGVSNSYPWGMSGDIPVHYYIAPPPPIIR